MIFWIFIVGIIITVIAVAMKIAVVEKKSKLHPKSESDYAKLIIFQVILGRNVEDAVEFTRKCFIYYGCWNGATGKPTYAPRAVEIFRPVIRGKARLGRDALQYLIAWMNSYLQHAAQIESGTGDLSDLPLEGEWAFRDDTGEIDFNYAMIDLWDWGEFAKYWVFGISVVVDLVLGIVFQRWELLIGSALLFAEQISSVVQWDYSTSIKVVNKYLDVAQQAHDTYGNVDSEEAQNWIRGSMDSYLWDNYEVTVTWD